ncbi:hypothetical protein EMCRGX_G000164 [Ephydatia muelleri]
MPSRINRKKRTKQRAEYLQKQEENKAKARERYKADPEKKKASVRESYKADPEKKKASVRESYIANIEPKRAAKRQRYGEDLEENRAAKRQRYGEDLEENRAAKRQRYGEDLEENRAVKRQRYQESVEENRAAKRRIYRGNSATIKAARMSRYWKGRRTTTTTTTTTQSYSLFEPNSRTLAEYGVSLEKAILRDSELLSDVNNAFCNSHPLLAQKVVTRSARAALREMYHAKRWCTDARFASPMAVLRDGTVVFVRDCVLLFYHSILGIVAMASEITNHLRGAANKLIVLKTLQLYVPKELEKSILQQIAEINSQHTEAAKATLRTQFGLDEAYNIFLDILPIDLYHTPLEALHQCDVAWNCQVSIERCDATDVCNAEKGNTCKNQSLSHLRL